MRESPFRYYYIYIFFLRLRWLFLHYWRRLHYTYAIFVILILYSWLLRYCFLSFIFDIISLFHITIMRRHVAWLLFISLLILLLKITSIIIDLYCSFHGFFVSFIYDIETACHFILLYCYAISRRRFTLLEMPHYIMFSVSLRFFITLLLKRRALFFHILSVFFSIFAISLYLLSHARILYSSIIHFHIFSHILFSYFHFSLYYIAFHTESLFIIVARHCIRFITYFDAR